MVKDMTIEFHSRPNAPRYAMHHHPRAIYPSLFFQFTIRRTMMSVEQASERSDWPGWVGGINNHCTVVGTCSALYKSRVI